MVAREPVTMTINQDRPLGLATERPAVSQVLSVIPTSIPFTHPNCSGRPTLDIDPRTYETTRTRGAATDVTHEDTPQEVWVGRTKGTVFHGGPSQ